MLKIWENSILVDGCERCPRTYRPGFSFCSAPCFAPLSGLHFLCQVRDEMETVQRQLKLTPLKAKRIPSVSPNLEFSDFGRYDVYESALPNKVLPQCK